MVIAMNGRYIVTVDENGIEKIVDGPFMSKTLDIEKYARYGVRPKKEILDEIKNIPALAFSGEKATKSKVIITGHRYLPTASIDVSSKKRIPAKIIVYGASPTMLERAPDAIVISKYLPGIERNIVDGRIAFLHAVNCGKVR